MSTMPDLSAEILALFVGKTANRWPGKEPSAIGKLQATDELRLDWDGFVEDQQADLEFHGGPEKALHHYAADHMDHWREAFPDADHNFIPGCFGENISTVGLHENNLCLGDILTLGSAKVQICQGRQPCWKLNAHTGIDAMGAAFRRTARVGWYYRVLETGQVKAGDTIRLVERPCPDWSVEKVTKARFDPKLSPDTAREIADLPVISQAWRDDFLKKAG